MTTLCTDCTWHQPHARVADSCLHPNNPTSVVDGKPIYRECRITRQESPVSMPNRNCGPKASWFKGRGTIVPVFVPPKPPRWWRWLIGENNLPDKEDTIT